MAPQPNNIWLAVNSEYVNIDPASKTNATEDGVLYEANDTYIVVYFVSDHGFILMNASGASNVFSTYTITEIVEYPGQATFTEALSRQRLYVPYTQLGMQAMQNTLNYRM